MYCIPFFVQQYCPNQAVISRYKVKYPHHESFDKQVNQMQTQNIQEYFPNIWWYIVTQY